MACSGFAGPPAGRFVQVSTGTEASPAASSFACGITTEGIIACWGANTYGESSPPAGPFTEVAAGESRACAISQAGGIWCWGVFARQPL